MDTKVKRTSPRRILEVVEAICRSPRTATPALLAQTLDIPLATIYRLLETLVEERFIASSPSGAYIPGDRLRTLVLDSLQYEPKVTERRAILRKLSDQLNETVSLSVPQGTKLIYFDRVESHWPFQVTLKIGDPLPLHCCASGKLYLSTFTIDAALAVLENIRPEKRARNTITANDSFSAELARIDADGYALDDQEWFDDMVGAAVPIRNRDGAFCASLSTHALITRKSLADIEAQIPDMMAAAEALQNLFFDGG